MAAGTWTFTNGGRTCLLDGTFDLDTDVWWMGLHVSTGTQPGPTIVNWSELSDSQVSTTNTGYATGGKTLKNGGGAGGLTLSGTNPVKVDIETDPVFGPAGSADLTAKTGVIYEVGGKVLCYCLLEAGGANVTATNGNTLTVAAHATDGVFKLS